MAVGLANNLLRSRNALFESVGLDAAPGCSADKRAISVMKELGIDISEHRTRSIASVTLGEFDYVVAMKDYIAEDLLTLDPSCKARLFVWDVTDPYVPGTLDDYRECAEHLRVLLSEFIASQLCREDERGK